MHQMFKAGHLKRNINESKHRCYQCKSNSHHTTACDKNEQNNHDVDKKKKRKRKKTTVYLQTARAYIFDDLFERNYVVKVLLDPGSQQTYIS